MNWFSVEASGSSTARPPLPSVCPEDPEAAGPGVGAVGPDAECYIQVALLARRPLAGEQLMLLSRLCRPRLRVVGCWGALPEFVHGMREAQVDVAIVDLPRTGPMDGIRAIRVIRDRFPKARILVLTQFERPMVVFEAIHAGAVGYLPEGAEADVLYRTMSEVVAGGAPMTGALARFITERLYCRSQAGATHPSGFPGSSGLDFEEFRLLGELMDGCRYHDLAGRSEVSHGTIRRRVRRILEKLHAGWPGPRFSLERPDPGLRDTGAAGDPGCESFDRFGQRRTTALVGGWGHRSPELPGRFDPDGLPHPRGGWMPAGNGSLEDMG